MFFQPKHLVFPIERPCTISLLPQGPVAVHAGDSYALKIEAFSGLRRYAAQQTGRAYDESKFAFFETVQPLSLRDGALCLDLAFPQEDRWLCTVMRNGETLEQFEVYSLEPDLYPLTPFKGDNHMHTCLSDGRESPEYRVADYCRRGYDYVVVTDHSCYDASVRARAMVERLNIPYLVIAGEEIHAPGNKVHIINMGGNAGVTEWYRQDPDGYNAAVEARQAEITAPMSAQDKWMVASSLEIFDRIHERGGVAIFCHPYWILQGKLQHSEDVTRYLFDHKAFDVYEMVAGGAYEEGTQMQISYYHQLPQMPIVGSSDTHRLSGGTLEPGYFTIAFAPALTAGDICEAVRAGRCIAGYENKLYGDYRLLKYGYFLLKNVFPQHDRQQFTLGDQLLFHVSSGMPKDDPRIEKMHAVTSAQAYFESLRW